jgi:hypothetical protein
MVIGVISCLAGSGRGSWVNTTEIGINSSGSDPCAAYENQHQHRHRVFIPSCLLRLSTSVTNEAAHYALWVGGDAMKM